MPRSFLVKKTDKQKDRHEKYQNKEKETIARRVPSPSQDPLPKGVTESHVVAKEFESHRPAVIVEIRPRIEDDYQRVDVEEIHESHEEPQGLHSPATDEGYSESPLYTQSPTPHGVNKDGSTPTYSPHMTPPPREVMERVESPGHRISPYSHIGHEEVVVHHNSDVYCEQPYPRSTPPLYPRGEHYRQTSPSPPRRIVSSMDYAPTSPQRHLETYYERYSRRDGYFGDYGRPDGGPRARGEVFGRPESPARSRSPLDLTVRSTAEPVASAVAPFTPAIPNLSARLSNGYLRDALATSFYRALTTDMAPSDGGSHHGYTSTYTSSPSSTSGGRLTPQGIPGYVTSPSRASVSSMSPTSPQKAQMSPLCTSVAPSPTPSPALSIQSDSDESLYSSSGRKIERKGGEGTAFQDGVTVGYTYDAFFISDGRSRRKNSMGIPEKTRARYTCNECGKHYATSSNLSRHKQTHRSVDSKLAKKCPHCNKVYVSMPALSMHILTHELKHTCMVCNKSFSRPWLLQGHMRSHTGDKPYGCAHCGKAFADRSNLRAHMQTHSAFKHYECKRCNKTFALKSYLNKHYESACFKES